MPRAGKGSKVNPVRTDLNTAAPTGSDREFGAASKDQAALDAVPLERPEPILPGGLGSLAAPSNRPDEPITNGIAAGPGRGPEARMIQPQNAYRSPLERIAEMTQNPRLLDLVRNIYG